MSPRSNAASAPRAPRPPHGKGLDRTKLSTSSSRRDERQRDDPALSPRSRSGLRRQRSSRAAPRRGGARGGRDGTGLRRDAERPEDELLRALDVASRWLAPGPGSGRRCRPSSPSADTGAACSRRARTSIFCSFCPRRRRRASRKSSRRCSTCFGTSSKRSATRRASVDECLKQARGDMTIRTSLIEARFLSGDKRAVRDAADRIRQGDRRQDGVRIRRRQARGARAAGQARRAHRAISSSPTSRRAKGGLRDLNTLFWIAKYVYRVRDAHELDRGRPVFAAGIRAFSPLRGIPLVGALPPAFPRRPGRGASELRRAAADRRASSAIRRAPARPTSSAS